MMRHNIHITCVAGKKTLFPERFHRPKEAGFKPTGEENLPAFMQYSPNPEFGKGFPLQKERKCLNKS